MNNGVVATWADATAPSLTLPERNSRRGIRSVYSQWTAPPAPRSMNRVSAAMLTCTPAGES